jgi:repressor LexA
MSEGRCPTCGKPLAQPPKTFGATPRMAELLAFITDYIAEAGFAPSYKEMASVINVRSNSSIHRMVLALEERGLIRRLPDRVRSIEVVERTGP